MSTTVKVERQGFKEDNVQQELELSEAKEKDEVSYMYTKFESKILMSCMHFMFDIRGTQLMQRCKAKQLHHLTDIM